MNKTSVREQILHRLHAELSLQAQAAQVSRDEAIDEESRAENRWDTHSQEAAYLAEGQSRLVADIGASIGAYEALPLPAFGADAAIDIGALVEIEAAGERSWYFIGPRSGGIELVVEGQPVLVVTPQSPLGREMIGKRTGDLVQPAGRSAATAWRIVSVA